SDEGKLRKALESGADAVVADLEDAVAPAEKGAARALVQRLFSETVPVTAYAEGEPSAGSSLGTVLRVLRVNAAETPYFQEDLALGGGRRPTAVRRRPPRYPRRGRPRRGVRRRALARLPRQGLHPPRPDSDRQPRLRAERARDRVGREGGRRVREPGLGRHRA